jgi:hypothetical protein
MQLCDTFMTAKEQCRRVMRVEPITGIERAYSGWARRLVMHELAGTDHASGGRVHAYHRPVLHDENHLAQQIRSMTRGRIWRNRQRLSPLRRILMG